jgi:hypothetical protein
MKLDSDPNPEDGIVTEELDFPADTDVEQVILVHGTFASSADDCGEGWWQVGSEAYVKLEQRLPHGVELAPEGKVFRWSGDNTERARSKAASQLLRFVEPLEKAGTPYHLIGHSHGGSVIWAALRTATARRKSLKHLRSWSTVGTPYMHHRSKSPWSPVTMIYMVLAAALLIPAGRSFKALIDLPYDVATGQLKDGIIIEKDEKTDYVTLAVRTPILKGLDLIGIGTTETDAGRRLGSFDPKSGRSAGDFMFRSLEGWIIMAAIVLFGYITLLLGCFFLSPVYEGFRIGWEKRLEQRAFERYRKRWLGLWTEDDEAINGLRATMDLTVSFIGDLAVRERIFVSDLLSVPSRPLYRLVAPLFNHVIRPLIDSKIREIVIKTAQGNDRPAARVVAVSPHPVLQSAESEAPPLPERLQTSIRQRADLHANELGPKLRVLLAQPSITAGLESFGRTLSGRELVHTSYFDHPEVIDLLALNICWSRRGNQPRRASTSAEIIHWFNEFKRKQGAKLRRRGLAKRPKHLSRQPSQDQAA